MSPGNIWETKSAWASGVSKGILTRIYIADGECMKKVTIIIGLLMTAVLFQNCAGDKVSFSQEDQSSEAETADQAQQPSIPAPNQPSPPPNPAPTPAKQGTWKDYSGPGRYCVTTTDARKFAIRETPVEGKSCTILNPMNYEYDLRSCAPAGQLCNCSLGNTDRLCCTHLGTWICH